MSTIQPPLSDLPDQPKQPEDSSSDQMLEKLAAVTGLFNPALIVEELQQLDSLDDTPDEQPSPKVTPNDTAKPYDA